MFMCYFFIVINTLAPILDPVVLRYSLQNILIHVSCGDICVEVVEI
jgi:hypothetical protein